MPSLRKLLQSKSQNAKERRTQNSKLQLRFKGKTRVSCITKTPEDEINSDTVSLSSFKMRQGTTAIVTTNGEMSVDVAVLVKDEAEASCADQTTILSSSLNESSFVDVAGINDLPVPAANLAVSGKHADDFKIYMGEKSSLEPKEQSWKREHATCLLPKRRNALYPRHYNKGSVSIPAFATTVNRNKSKSQEMKDRDCVEEAKRTFPGRTTVSECISNVKTPSKEVFEDMCHDQGSCYHKEACSDSGKENAVLHVKMASDCFNQVFLSSIFGHASIDSISEDHIQSLKDLDISKVSAFKTTKSDCFNEAFLSSCCSLGPLLNGINQSEACKDPNTGETCALKTAVSDCFNKAFLSIYCGNDLLSTNEMNGHKKSSTDSGTDIMTAVKMAESVCFDETFLSGSCSLELNDINDNKNSWKDSEAEKMPVLKSADSDCFNEAFLSSSCSLGLQNKSDDCNDHVKTCHHPKTNKSPVFERVESDFFNKAFLSSSCNLGCLSNHTDIYGEMKPDKDSEIRAKIQEQLNQGFSSSLCYLPEVNLSKFNEEADGECRSNDDADTQQMTHHELCESLVRKRCWYEAEGESYISTPVAQSRIPVEEESSSFIEDISISTTRCTDENTVIDSSLYSFFPNPTFKDLIRQTPEAVFFSCGGFFDCKMSEVPSCDDTNREGEVLCGDHSDACPVLSLKQADKKEFLPGIGVTAHSSSKLDFDIANIKCSMDHRGLTQISHTKAMECCIEEETVSVSGIKTGVKPKTPLRIDVNKDQNSRLKKIPCRWNDASDTSSMWVSSDISIQSNFSDVDLCNGSVASSHDLTTLTSERKDDIVDSSLNNVNRILDSSWSSVESNSSVSSVYSEASTVIVVTGSQRCTSPACDLEEKNVDGSEQLCIRANITDHGPSDEREKLPEACNRLINVELTHLSFMREGTLRFSRTTLHGILSAHQYHMIFQNVEKLKNFSEYLMREMKKDSHLYSESSTSCSLDFGTARKRIGIYSSKIRQLCEYYEAYAKGFSVASQLLEQLLTTNQQFAHFTETVSGEGRGILAIRDFLLEPLNYFAQLYTTVAAIYAVASKDSPEYSDLQYIFTALRLSLNFVAEVLPQNCRNRLQIAHPDRQPRNK